MLLLLRAFERRCGQLSCAMCTTQLLERRWPTLVECVDRAPCPTRVRNYHTGVPDLIIQHLHSRAFQIEQVPGSGRGLIATTRIPKGAVVHKEKPMLCHPLLANSSQVCHHCLKVVETQRSSSSSPPSQVQFCSTRCKDQASATYYDAEQRAGHFAALREYCKHHNEKFPLLAARLACQMLTQSLNDIPQQKDTGQAHKDMGFLCFANVSSPPPEPWLESYKLMQHGLQLIHPASRAGSASRASSDSSTAPIGSLTSLSSTEVAAAAQGDPPTPAAASPPDSRQQHACAPTHPQHQASHATQIDSLQQQPEHSDTASHDSQSETTQKQQQVMQSLDLHWWVGVLSRLHPNCFRVDAVMPFDWSDMASAAAAVAAGGPQGSSGTAVYLTASLFNHSCNPNLDVTFPLNDGMLVLVAARDIDAGEQLSISYIDSSMPVQERLKVLHWVYGFTCCCPRCLEQQDLGDEGA